MVRLGPNAMGFAAIHPSVAEVARTLDGPPSLRVTPPLRKRALRYGTAGYPDTVVRNNWRCAFAYSLLSNNQALDGTFRSEYS